MMIIGIATIAIVIAGLLIALYMGLRHKGDIDLTMNIKKGEINIKKKK